MKEIHKKAAAVLFAAAMTGLSAGTAFTGLPGSMTVWAEEAELETETPAETQEETQPSEQTEAVTEEKTTQKTLEEVPEEIQEEATENPQADSTLETETAEEQPEIQPEIQITLTSPEGWQTEKTAIGIRIEDVKNTGSFSVSKVEARISEDGGWMDVTQVMSVEITSNCSVYVRVTDQNGRTYEQNRYVECFDKAKPTLSAAAKNGILVIQGADEGSGVAAIYVNGNEFTELTDGILKVRLQKADTTYQHFTLQVRDKAGNLSENYKVANPYYENPDAKPETSGGTGEGQKNNSLPSDAAATPPTSATGTVTEHQSTSGASSEPTEPENVTTETDADIDTGRVQGTASGAVQEGGKEFYTIQTKSNKVFYLIVDKDKTDDNVYLLTEVGENDLLNFTDSNTVTLPQNHAVIESALPLEPVKETEEPDTSKEDEKTEKEPEKETEKTESNSGTILLMIIVLAAVGGGYYYLKFVKGKNSSFDSDYDDEDEEEEEPGEEEDGEMEETEPEEEEYQ